MVSVHSDDVFVTVVIEEKQPLIGTSRLMMMVGAKDYQLKQWTVTDPQGYDTTVAVYNLDTSRGPIRTCSRSSIDRNDPVTPAPARWRRASARLRSPPCPPL